MLILNDIHLDLNNLDAFTRPGQELSLNMLNDILEEASARENREGNAIDAILLIGDLVNHALAGNSTYPDPSTNWPDM